MQAHLLQTNSHACMHVLEKALEALKGRAAEAVLEMLTEGRLGVDFIEGEGQVERAASREHRVQRRERRRRRVRVENVLEGAAAWLRGRAEESGAGGDSGDELACEDGEGAAT